MFSEITTKRVKEIPFCFEIVNLVLKNQQPHSDGEGTHQTSKYVLEQPKTTDGSDSILGEEDDEEDLLKEDVEQWDIFEDHHKFVKREQQLKKKKRKEAKQELDAIQN